MEENLGTCCSPQILCQDPRQIRAKISSASYFQDSRKQCVNLQANSQTSCLTLVAFLLCLSWLLF